MNVTYYLSPSISHARVLRAIILKQLLHTYVRSKYKYSLTCPKRDHAKIRVVWPYYGGDWQHGIYVTA